MRTAILCLCAATATWGAPAPGRPGEPMAVTAGNDVGWQVASPEEGMRAFRESGSLRCGPEAMTAHWNTHGKLYAEHGVTAFEPYVKWMLMEPREGVWDPSFYDAELAAFKANGLRWVPFLIAGPAYATPPWFKESKESVFARDLASGDLSRDQSIWNPHLKPRLRAWLERFFTHYDHADMQAVLLGISGVFGESIYTAGGNVWTHIWDGAYPQHLGWWCGDEFAAADFRDTVRAKYATVDALNRAWKTTFASFDEVAPFVPAPPHAERARLDMVRWYMGSMTDFAEWWIVTVRELAPYVPVLLCTGGGAQPELGADMAAQTKMAARHGAGIRITNEASDYAANFHLTRHIGSAAQLYGTYFGYEPAGAVSEDGIVARVYNAVASGAWELFHYDNPPSGPRGERYKRYLDLLTVRRPVLDVAMFWPRTSADLGRTGGLGSLGGALRDRCDIEYVDEVMIADGALSGLRALVWGAGPVTEEATAEAIREAVRNGLTLVVPEGWRPRSPEGEPLFPASLTRPREGFGTFSIPALSETDEPGTPGRGGIFHGAEPDSLWGTPGQVCWTSGTVTLRIPVPKDKAARILIPYRIGNLQEPVRFLADSVPVHRAAPGTVGDARIPVPDAARARGTVTVTVEAKTWNPAAAGESDDARDLSVMLRDVIVAATDAAEPGNEPTDAIRTRRSEGRGHIVEAAGTSPRNTAAALGAFLRNPGVDRAVAPSAETCLDAEEDGVYLTVTETDLLYYNHGDVPRTVRTPGGTAEIPAHAIVRIERKP